MSKIIIGIHGLGAKPLKDILTKWWRYSIREGVDSLGFPEIRFKLDLVYWAHIVHSQPLDPTVKDKNDPLFVEYPYVPAVKIERGKPHTLRLKLLEYLEKQMDKLFLNDNLAVDISAISDVILSTFFKDLNIYYSHTCEKSDNSCVPAKKLICDQLVTILNKHKRKKILLIAHSMGSIIAYDALSQLSPNIQIDTFITLGSPLGLPIILNKIMAEEKRNYQNKISVQTPESIVGNWYNLSDPEDKVALNYNLGDDFLPNSRNITAIDKVVQNSYEVHGKKNPHSVLGYLRTPEFAEIICDFAQKGRSGLSLWIEKTWYKKFVRIIKKMYSKPGN